MRFAYPLLLALLASGCRKEEPAARSTSPSGQNTAVAAEAAGVTPSPTVERKDGMVRLPGGTFLMGHDGAIDTPSGAKSFPEEGPAHEVNVEPFWIDETEVTNAQFAAFVKATGYITFAEKPMPAAEGGAPVPYGAIVFRENAAVLGDPNLPGRAIEWWKIDPDANWRHPTGKGSNLDGKDDHPVVCLTHDDATAYAKWAGKRLPTEAEWEFAARGGLSGKIYVWGDEWMPGGKWMANTWQGEFPNKNTAGDGFVTTAPVRTFPANGYGLYDMAGNAWEMCSDLFDPTYFSACDPKNPKGPATWVNRDTGLRGDGNVHRVTKGGSFLCHDSYCVRYRPAARHSQDTESPANHTGFRCVK